MTRQSTRRPHRPVQTSVVGRPLGGYDFVLPPESELERLGIDIVAHTSEELAEHCDRLMDSDVAGLRAELSEQFGAVTTELGLDAALRYSVALREIVLGDGASAGAVNCHSPAIRGNSRFGEVAPCFALGRETSCGRPFTCTGDVNTSLAMLIVASLSLAGTFALVGLVLRLLPKRGPFGSVGGALDLRFLQAHDP